MEEVKEKDEKKEEQTQQTQQSKQRSQKAQTKKLEQEMDAAFDGMLPFDDYFRRQRERADELRKLIVLGFVFAVCILVLIFASTQNPGIYEIDVETLRYINMAFNASILMIIPFIMGSAGAVTRLMMSGMLVAKNIYLIIASGGMSVISWVSIKSGILTSIVAPHLEKQGFKSQEIDVFSQHGFYTMMLVAIFVGMFSTNIYIFINNKVDYLMREKKKSSESS